MKTESLFSSRFVRTPRKLIALWLSPKASMTKLLSATLIILAASILGTAQAGAQVLQWAVNYNGISSSALEEVEGVVVDESGNVFATGLSGNGTGSAIRTMRLSPSGTIQWTRVETKSSLCGGMWGTDSACPGRGRKPDRGWRGVHEQLDHLEPVAADI